MKCGQHKTAVYNKANTEKECVRSVAQSRPTLRDPMNCSPPGSSDHEIFQAKLLDWLSFPPPGDLPDPATGLTPPGSPALVGGFFTTEPSGKQ